MILHDRVSVKFIEKLDNLDNLEDRLTEMADDAGPMRIWIGNAIAALRVFAAGGQFPRHETGRAEETSLQATGNEQDSIVVKSCPTCGTVTDIDYRPADEPAITLAKG